MGGGIPPLGDSYGGFFLFEGGVGVFLYIFLNYINLI